MKELIDWFKRDIAAVPLFAALYIFVQVSGPWSHVGFAVVSFAILIRYAQHSKLMSVLIVVAVLALGFPERSSAAQPISQRSGMADVIADGKRVELAGAQCGLAILVLVIGALYVYKLYRCCQKIESTNRVGPLEKADAASIHYGGATCLASDSSETVVAVVGQPTPDGVRLTVSPLATQPLDRSQIPYGQNHWNGLEWVEPQMSLISFHPGTVRVEPAEISYRLQRSWNLIFWEDVVRMEMPADGTFWLEDSFEESAMFYRVR